MGLYLLKTDTDTGTDTGTDTDTDTGTVMDIVIKKPVLLNVNDGDNPNLSGLTSRSFLDFLAAKTKDSYNMKLNISCIDLAQVSFLKLLRFYNSPISWTTSMIR